jgi:hypothetical protein
MTVFVSFLGQKIEPLTGKKRKHKDENEIDDDEHRKKRFRVDNN